MSYNESCKSASNHIEGKIGSKAHKGKQEKLGLKHSRRVFWGCAKRFQPLKIQGTSLILFSRIWGSTSSFSTLYCGNTTSRVGS